VGANQEITHAVLNQSPYEPKPPVNR